MINYNEHIYFPDYFTPSIRSVIIDTCGFMRNIDITSCNYYTPDLLLTYQGYFTCMLVLPPGMYGCNEGSPLLCVLGCFLDTSQPRSGS